MHFPQKNQQDEILNHSEQVLLMNTSSLARSLSVFVVVVVNLFALVEVHLARCNSCYKQSKHELN